MKKDANQMVPTNEEQTTRTLELKTKPETPSAKCEADASNFTKPNPKNY